VVEKEIDSRIKPLFTKIFIKEIIVKHKWMLELPTGTTMLIPADACAISGGALAFWKDQPEPKPSKRTAVLLEAFAPGEWKHCKLVS
jgi:hypothetical protein